MKDLHLINFVGADQADIPAQVFRILAELDVDILDVCHAVIHRHLNLGVLVALPEGIQVDHLSAHLGDADSLQGLVTETRQVDEEVYREWVLQQGQPKYIVTLLARVIHARHLAAVAAVAARHGLRCDNISRLSGRVDPDRLVPGSRACVELSVRGACDDLPGLRSELMELTSSMDVDVAVQEDNIFRRNRRLVCFDMDSTLIEAEVIDELAKLAGVGDQVVAITEQAMRGELDFDQSLARRVGLLKGLPETALLEVAQRLPLTEGAQRLVSSLRKLGFKTAILSGGFDYFGRHLQGLLGIDYVYANRLEIVDGELTGRVLGEVVNAQRKADLLRHLAQKEQVMLEQVIAVGDGANDLLMLREAGLGIAFRAKPLVKASASHAISQLGLDAILYLIGLRDRDWVALEAD